MKPCKYCGSEECQLTLTPELTHYGKYTCVKCDGFIGWAKKPAVADLNKQRMTLVFDLLSMSSISSWERQFLTSIGRQLSEGKTLSPAQLQTLDKIGTQYAIK